MSGMAEFRLDTPPRHNEFSQQCLELNANNISASMSISVMDGGV